MLEVFDVKTDEKVRVSLDDPRKFQYLLDTLEIQLVGYLRKQSLDGNALNIPFVRDLFRRTKESVK